MNNMSASLVYHHKLAITGLAPPFQRWNYIPKLLKSDRTGIGMYAGLNEL